jgi:hypothetical protein
MEAVTSTQGPKALSPLFPDMTMSLSEFLALLDEIKVMILEYILPTGVTFTVGSFNKALSNTPGWDQPKNFETHVLPLLIAIPAIKEVVYDVLFAANMISTWPFVDEFCGVMYPPASINTCIRRIELRLEIDNAGLVFLSRFASSVLGFLNLLEVDIILDGNSALYGDGPG